MNRSHKILLTAVAAATLGLGATFASAEMHGEGHGGRHSMHGDRAAMMTQHLAKLKTNLKITALQENAWQAFAGKVQQTAQSMKAVHDAQKTAPQTQTAPERIDQHIAMAKQHVVNMEDIGNAAKQLYAGLSPEQKLVADKEMAHMGGRHH